MAQYISRNTFKRTKRQKSWHMPAFSTLAYKYLETKVKLSKFTVFTYSFKKTLL